MLILAISLTSSLYTDNLICITVVVEDVNEDDSSDDEDDIRQKERARASAAEQSFNEHATEKEKEEREELIRKARAAAIESMCIYCVHVMCTCYVYLLWYDMLT